MSTTNCCQHPDTRTTTRLAGSALCSPAPVWRSCCSVPASRGTQDRPKEITNSIGMKLVLIPAGKFVMGSPRMRKTVRR